MINNSGQWLLVEALAELNETKHREMYVEMQRIVSDDGGAVVLMFANYVLALSDQLQHEPNMSGNWSLDGERYMERWWFG